MLCVFMLIVFMLSVFMLSVFMLCVFMLIVFMLSVFMLSVYMLGVFVLSVFMSSIFMLSTIALSVIVRNIIILICLFPESCVIPSVVNLSVNMPSVVASFFKPKIIKKIPRVSPPTLRQKKKTFCSLSTDNKG